MQIGQNVTVLLHRSSGITRKSGQVININDNADNNAPGGEPAITVIFLSDDPKKLADMNGPDWHNALQREVGVLHDSHPNAEGGKTGTTYVAAEDSTGDDAATANVLAANTTSGISIVIPEADQPWFVEPNSLRDWLDAVHTQLQAPHANEARPAMAYISERVQGLQADSDALRAAKADAEKQQEQVESLNEQIEALKKTNSDQANTIEQQDDQIEALKDTLKEYVPTQEADSEVTVESHEANTEVTDAAALGEPVASTETTEESDKFPAASNNDLTPPQPSENGELSSTDDESAT